MAQRVTLDAMIPRQDFSVTSEREFDLDLFRDFPVAYLRNDSHVLKLIRKPDFQRETNHWTPEQVATFIASFLDNEVIPSLILWKSPSYIFVIDGGHRLSALRAWLLDDYGDGEASLSYFKGVISEDQRKAAKRTRQLVEKSVGRADQLNNLVSQVEAQEEVQVRRANRLVTRAITLQWIQGNPEQAETSFFKINSQGTPLDDTEEMLIRNRKKPIAIGARGILRSGTGHQYWSYFSPKNQAAIRDLAGEIYGMLFEPEAATPIRTLDVPFGGNVSPVDALSLLIDLLTVAGVRQTPPPSIEKIAEDKDGNATLKVLKNTLEILKRITGNSPGSLGLHPAVYFYNERGKYSRFLFLGMVSLIADRVTNNDKEFFKKFTVGRKRIEQFLLDNKIAIGLVLQNMSRAQRVPRMRSLFEYLTHATTHEGAPDIESVFTEIGVRGKFLDLQSLQSPEYFTDDTKSELFIREALGTVLPCAICGGFLQPTKSLSYDHVKRRRDGGLGHISNGQMVHPYCNTGFKN